MKKKKVRIADFFLIRKLYLFIIIFDLFYLVYYLKAIEVSITFFSNTIDMLNFLFNKLLSLIFKGVIINIIIMFLINKTYGLLGGEQ